MLKRQNSKQKPKKLNRHTSLTEGRGGGGGGGGGGGQDHVQQLLLTLHSFHYGICIEKRNTCSLQTVVYFELF